VIGNYRLVKPKSAQNSAESAPGRASRRSTKFYPSSIIERAEQDEGPAVRDETVSLRAFPAVSALIGFGETTISAVRGASDGELGSRVLKATEGTTCP
jgi:hypothetical protein